MLASFFECTKFYLVAILATAKAVKCICIRVNLHAWFVVRMEWAFEHVVSVRPQAVVFEYDFNGQSGFYLAYFHGTKKV